MSKTLYLCEKPKVGRELAAVLGSPQPGDGYIVTNRGLVTWGIGHLITTAEPDAYNPVWADRGFIHLPIIPTKFKMVPAKETFQQKQLRVVVAQLKALGPNDTVVISTDPGTEGELIGRELLDYVGCRAKVLRFWTNATTNQALVQAVNNLQPGENYEAFGESARARSHADWMIGMNLSRAFTAITGSSRKLSIGRVVTPTLAMIVHRDLIIANFKPKDFFEVAATVKTSEGNHQLTLRHSPSEENRMWERPQAQAIADAAQGQSGRLKVEMKPVITAPPNPPSLTDIQRLCNTRFNWPAKKTLEVAQELYETHKATTYPRTDFDCLREEQWVEVPTILRNLKSMNILPEWPTGWEPLQRKSVWDTSKTGDHHAIIPTDIVPKFSAFSADEQKLYVLIAQLYVGCLMPNAEALKTEVSMTLDGAVFKTSGTVPKVKGWKALYPEAPAKAGAKGAAAAPAENVLPPVTDGMTATVQGTQVVAKQTAPPDPYTEASLLADMDGAAKFVKDPRLRKLLGSEDLGGMKGSGANVNGVIAKKGKGLGTPATRADTIEKLKGVDYVEVQGKKLISTPFARKVIAFVEKHLPEYTDPGLTATWEIEQEKIREGTQTYDGFMSIIGEAMRAAMLKLREVAPPAVLRQGQPVECGTLCPKSGKPVIELVDAWGFPGFPGLRARKRWAGRKMALAEYVEVLGKEGEPGPVLTGFVGNPKGKETVGKPFEAAFKYDPKTVDGKQSWFSFVFANSGGAQGNAMKINNVSCPEILIGRTMTKEDYQQIFDAGKAGAVFSGLVGKSGKPFEARITYNPKAERSKFELSFDNDRGGESKGTGAKPATKPAGKGRGR